MKILYYINLFFVCCSSFTIQPSYSLVKYNNINNNLIKLRKPLIFINGFNKNKKNNDIDIYDNDIYDNEPITTKIIKKFINYIIIWIYINLLFSIIYEMKKMI
jgi:hypothetical protein